MTDTAPILARPGRGARPIIVTPQEVLDAWPPCRVCGGRPSAVYRTTTGQTTGYCPTCQRVYGRQSRAEYYAQSRAERAAAARALADHLVPLGLPERARPSLSDARRLHEDPEAFLSGRWVPAMRDARGRPSGRTWQAVRALILDRDGYRCQIELPVICVGDADQVDHEIPIVMGGSDAAGNLRAACRPCNSRPNVGRAEWPPRPARAVADLTPRQLDMVAELDRLGLPDTIGRTAVLRYLREHGVAAGIGSRTLDRACQYRGSRT